MYVPEFAKALSASISEIPVLLVKETDQEKMEAAMHIPGTILSTADLTTTTPAAGRRWTWPGSAGCPGGPGPTTSS